jgi:hypothetical protein
MSDQMGRTSQKWKIDFAFSTSGNFPAISAKINEGVINLICDGAGLSYESIEALSSTIRKALHRNDLNGLIGWKELNDYCFSASTNVWICAVATGFLAWARRYL